MTDSIRLTTAFVASALMHLLLAAMVMSGLLMTANTITPPRLVDIDLAQLPEPKKAAPPRAKEPAAAAAPEPPPVIPLPRSIVSPPDQGEEKAPAKTRLLSDRDNSVAEQKVRVGEPGRSDVAKRERATDNLPERDGGTKVGGAEKEIAAAPEKKQAKQQVAALPRLDELFAAPGDLARAGIGQASPPKPTPQAQAKVHRDLLGGSGTGFSSRPGIADYLPDVREGSVTLLNTKAERFAPFVRRVATRIFQHMSIRLSQSARRGVAGSGRDIVVVEAVMNRQGRMVNARIVEQQLQTSLGVDRELLNATRPETFFDSNPPDGAEGNDGNIHFILVVDLNVQSGTDARSNRPSTGYYGVISVGLDALQRRG